MSVSRRRFLTGAAAMSLAAMMNGLAGASDPDTTGPLMQALAPEGDDVTVAPRPSVRTFAVERPTDLVQLDITFTGFTSRMTGRALTALVPGAGSFISVQFPPQAIGEAAYPYSPPDDWFVDPPPVLSVLSGPSRLCFSTSSPVRFSNPMVVTDLLDWDDWTLLLPALAAKAPALDETCIEYPYGLFVAPATAPTAGHQRVPHPSRFAGPLHPLASTTQVTDCWTAAFGPSTAATTMAAVWSREQGRAGHGATPNGPLAIAYATTRPRIRRSR